MSRSDLLSIPKTDSVRSGIILQVGNGHGSVAAFNRIRRYIVPAIYDKGSDLTVIDSVTDGTSIRIGTPGLYYCYAYDICSASAEKFAITVNDTDGGSNVNAIATKFVPLGVVISPAANVTGSTGGILNLNPGDILRVHDETGLDNTNFGTGFQVFRIG